MHQNIGPRSLQQSPQGRRTSPRIEVDGQTLARLLTLDAQVSMRDVSFGGFKLASTIPVSPGDVHAVQVVTATGLACTVEARVVRCDPPTTTEPFYISGWAVIDTPDSRTALGAIIDSLTERLQFVVDADDRQERSL